MKTHNKVKKNRKKNSDNTEKMYRIEYFTQSFRSRCVCELTLANIVSRKPNLQVFLITLIKV